MRDVDEGGAAVQRCGGAAVRGYSLMSGVRSVCLVAGGLEFSGHSIVIQWSLAHFVRVIQWSFNGHSMVIQWSFSGHSMVIQ